MLTQRWGRVGVGQGQRLVRLFEAESQASENALSTSKAKFRRGYQPVG
ncbi:WGR domain-containing protein [Shimia gijangensis]